MLIRAQLIAVVLSVALLAVVVILVRRGTLRDRYAVLWLLIGSVSVTASSIPARIWDSIAELLGIANGSTLLLVIGLFGALALILQLAMALTKMERQIIGHILENKVSEALGASRLDSDE